MTLVAADNGRFNIEPIEYVFIKDYQTIDTDNWSIFIVVNSNTRYKIQVRGITIPEYINILTKSEIREEKLNQIL